MVESQPVGFSSRRLYFFQVRDKRAKAHRRQSSCIFEDLISRDERDVIQSLFQHTVRTIFLPSPNLLTMKIAAVFALLLTSALVRPQA
jgi:hypothetical protein